MMQKAVEMDALEKSLPSSVQADGDHFLTDAVSQFVLYCTSVCGTQNILYN